MVFGFLCSQNRNRYQFCFLCASLVFLVGDIVFTHVFQLLGELLLDRHNFTIMTRYVSQPENLKTMMNMLRENSRNIQFEAFHVFKVILYSLLSRPSVSFLKLFYIVSGTAAVIAYEVLCYWVYQQFNSILTILASSQIFIIMMKLWVIHWLHYVLQQVVGWEKHFLRHF